MNTPPSSTNGQPPIGQSLGITYDGMAVDATNPQLVGRFQELYKEFAPSGSERHELRRYQVTEFLGTVGIVATNPSMFLHSEADNTQAVRTGQLGRVGRFLAPRVLRAAAALKAYENNRREKAWTKALAEFSGTRAE